MRDIQADGLTRVVVISGRAVGVAPDSVDFEPPPPMLDPALYDMLWAIGLAIGEDPEFTGYIRQLSESEKKRAA